MGRERATKEDCGVGKRAQCVEEVAHTQSLQELGESTVGAGGKQQGEGLGKKGKKGTKRARRSWRGEQGARGPAGASGGESATETQRESEEDSGKGRGRQRRIAGWAVDPTQPPPGGDGQVA